MSRPFRFDFLKWFYPGMHIKRWLALTVIGVAIMTFGLSYVVREAYLTGFTFPGFMYWVTLQFISRYIRGAVFMAGAGGLILFSIWKLNQSLISVLVPNRTNNGSLVNTIYTQRFLRRGPKIVAIGGGTGLSTLLRGLKEYTGNLTAIVTVADDGVGLPKDVRFDETDTLGLRLVRSLADQLDGAINVQNGRGTTFRLTFPIK